MNDRTRIRTWLCSALVGASCLSGIAEFTKVCLPTAMAQTELAVTRSPSYPDAERQPITRAELEAALEKAVTFFRNKVSVQGGYVYQISADGRYREGEGDAAEDIVWVQPPGTPAVGHAYLRAYQVTGKKYLLDAAIETAECLRRGQLKSGGWTNHILLSEMDRVKYVYRGDDKHKKNAKNWSSLDDDQTQSVIRFLAELDRELSFQNQDIHECVEYALKGLLANQYPNGGWAQGFQQIDTNREFPIVAASYPKEWSRKHPGEDYWVYYTLNDNAMVRVLDSLWTAYEAYDDPTYRDAAIRGADFLLLAQMPDPQPAWAQQYNFQMEPVWARKFEPTALSGSESQSVIEHLLTVCERTGEMKYLDVAERAIAYLKSIVLPDGRLARFYELRTNRPLFFTKDYQLTYDPSDVPTHYGFIVSNRLPALERRAQRIRELPSTTSNRDELLAIPNKKKMKEETSSDSEVRQVLERMDERGAWVERGELRYVKAVDHDGLVIRSETFLRNIDLILRELQTRFEEER